MKVSFIHTSDIHIGKRFQIKGFSLKEREKRRQEIQDTFDEIIRTARNEKTCFLFIAGDLTEGEYINFKTLKGLSARFKSIPDTKVVIACGKNDPYNNVSSLYEYIDWPENVYLIKNTRSAEKIYFQEEKLCVYSVSMDSNEQGLPLQAIYDISTDSDKLNVLLLHCDTGEEAELTSGIDAIKNKFDYCALGGRHNFSAEQDNIVYCGSPEPVSFDEEGEHGIVIGSLEKGTVEYEFKPMSKRRFITRNINLESGYSFNKILDLIKFSGDTFSNIKDYVRINLTGEVNTDVSMDEVENEARQFFYYIEFDENYIYKNPEVKVQDCNEFNIIESYKLQFENHQDKTEQQAFKLGLEVLRKEKVVN